MIAHRAPVLPERDVASFGYNVVSKKMEPQAVAFVDIFNGGWPRLVDRASIKGPLGASGEFLLPASTSQLVVTDLSDRAYLQVTLSMVRAGAFPNFPAEPGESGDTLPSEEIVVDWPPADASKGDDASREALGQVHEMLDALRARHEARRRR